MPWDPKYDDYVGFFDLEALAAYRVQADKYSVVSDNFHGELSIRSDYFKRLDDAAADAANISVRFGYRTLKNGELKLVVWLRDLGERAQNHLARWAPYAVPNNSDWLDYDQDDRFSSWVRV